MCSLCSYAYGILQTPPSAGCKSIFQCGYALKSIIQASLSQFPLSTREMREFANGSVCLECDSQCDKMDGNTMTCLGQVRQS